jgi:hypothetical protein
MSSRSVVQICLGIVVMSGLLTMIHVFQPAVRIFDDSPTWILLLRMHIETAAGLFFSTIGGAVVARSHFVVPALVICIAMWIASGIAAHWYPPFNTGEAVIQTLSYNWSGIVLSIIAVITGAKVGERFAKQRVRGRGNAA